MINKGKIKSQKGVTLMLLVVSVIILLIISAVVITNFRGEDVSLINSVENKSSELKKEKAKQDVEIAIEKIKMEKINEQNYTINVFIIDLETYLKKEDSNASVTLNSSNPAQIYDVKYLNNNFSYYFNLNEAPKSIKISQELKDKLDTAGVTLTAADLLCSPIIVNNLQGLISTKSSTNVTRSVVNGIITYTDTNGEKISTNSEYLSDGRDLWKAFDNNQGTVTYSATGSAQGYYIEIEFNDSVYAMSAKYIMDNGSKTPGKRLFHFDAFDERQNQWIKISNDIIWEGTMSNTNTFIKPLNYSSSYKKYRIFIDTSETLGNETYGAEHSGFSELQLYGIKTSEINDNSENNLITYLLSKANINELTTQQMKANSEFMLKLAGKNINTATSIIANKSSTNVTRSVVNGIITYTDTNGEKIRTNSEYTSEGYNLWKAFDNNQNTVTYSEIDSAQGYYIEFEFNDDFYATYTKFIMDNGSRTPGTRVLHFDAYDEALNQWIKISNDIVWVGIQGTTKQYEEELDCSNAYKKFRVYVDTSAQFNYSGVNGTTLSGFSDIILFGIKK